MLYCKIRKEIKVSMRVVVLMEEAFRIFVSNLVSAGKHIGIEFIPFCVPNGTVTADLQNQLENCLLKHKTNNILVVNDFKGNNEYFLKEKLLHTYNCYLWYLDSMKRCPLDKNRLLKYKKVSSFEIDDLEYAKNKFNVEVTYVPLVAGESFCLQPVDENCHRPIDVSFIGLVPKNSYRLQILNRLAKHCYEHNYNLKLYGHFWHWNHWYQRCLGKIKFRIKYPILAKYVENRFVQPEEAAEIYRKTKINLNIHIKEHKSYNCRTFEVLGNSNFLLSSHQKETNLQIRPGEHLVTYKSEEEFIDKIDYYLEHELEREAIAQRGGTFVRSNCKIDNYIQSLFN